MADAASFSLIALSVETYALVAVVALVSATLAGISGSGGAHLLVPLLAPIIGIKAVIPVLAVSMLLGNLSRVWAFRHSLQAGVALRLFLPTIPGAVVGTIIYDQLPERALYGLLGTFLLLAVPARRYLKRRQFSLSPRGVSVVGAGYGVIAGSMAGTGVVLVATLLGAGLSGAVLVATKALISVGLSVTKVVMFSTLSLLTPELVLTGLLMGACMIPSAYIARFLIHRMDIRLHTAIVEGVILIGAGTMIWRFVAWTT